jgi:hypothetical protein
LPTTTAGRCLGQFLITQAPLLFAGVVAALLLVAALAGTAAGEGGVGSSPAVGPEIPISLDDTRLNEYGPAVAWNGMAHEFLVVWGRWRRVFEPTDGRARRDLERVQDPDKHPPTLLRGARGADGSSPFPKRERRAVRGSSPFP